MNLIVTLHIAKTAEREKSQRVKNEAMKYWCSKFMYGTDMEWAGQRSQYSYWLRAGRSGHRIPVVARFSARPDRPWGPPSLVYYRYRVFPWGKERPGCDADPTPRSSAVVKKE